MFSKRKLPETEENLFIASSCEAKGIDFLLGKGKTSIRKISDEAEKATSIPAKTTAAQVPSRPKSYTITVDGRAYQVQVNAGGTPAVAAVSASIPVPVPAAPETSGIEISAPTPGNIVRLDVMVGDTIEKDQTLLLMEAMKMESEIKSPQDGVVQTIHVQSSDKVQTGDVLVTLRV